MRAWLDGYPLETSNPVGWTHTWGTEPHQRYLVVPARIAHDIFRGAKLHGSTLVLDDGINPAVTVKGLTVLSMHPTSHKDEVALRVVDRRWAWQFRHIFRYYNKRTTTGDLQRHSDANIPAAVQQLIPGEAYKKWSLQDGASRAWTIEECIYDVLDDLEPGNWIEDVESSPLEGYLVEELLLDDQGTGALARVLGYVGGAYEVTTNDDGQIVLTNRMDGRERALVHGSEDVDETRSRTRGAPPGGPAEFYGFPTWRLQDRRMERPSKYRVMFSREIELRFDFTGDYPDSSDVGERDDPPLHIENVLPIPDHVLDVDGERLVTGVWLPIWKYLEAKRGSWVPRELGDLNFAILRSEWLSSGLYEYAHPLLDEGGVAARAISTIKGHFRQTFKIPRAWAERLDFIRPTLVSIVDPKRATYASSPVFSDHALWLTWRAMWAEAKDIPADAYAIVRNVFARGDKTGGPIRNMKASELRRAPADLHVVDQDIGILHVSYHVDLTGEQAMVIPSAMDASDMPTTDPSKRNMWLQWGKLARTHQLSTIVTVGMGAPNDARVFHVVEVDVEEAAKRLGRETPQSDGPVMEIRIPSTLVAARFPWKDENADRVRLAFRFRRGDKGNPALLLGEPVNAAELREIAITAAARELSRLLDRVEGGHTGPLRSITPQGTAQVSYSIVSGPGGGAFTSLEMPPEAPAFDFMALLPDAVRKRVLRQIP